MIGVAVANIEVIGKTSRRRVEEIVTRRGREGRRLDDRRNDRSVASVPVCVDRGRARSIVDVVWLRVDASRLRW